LTSAKTAGSANEPNKPSRAAFFNEKNGELWRFVKTIGCLKKRENRVDAKPEM